ncbi:TetR/AcrR family transcriptional regulator [Stenotrophomonas sp. ISL-67]|uniref:TetR/AcrR family transcriptional regulator n=1 Tax=Stenotrophomonas sp. ISL-67 TaxID=2819171 RepID=UPI001BE63137|nr:TetR/AcrR family transcriptional regulator [Stenotrophomonas sp. ISL-67]MBT2767071.1 TetR/AcrR family transcriptional regulator [Stenotrophomonas sp. ISL-67]
MTPPDLPSSDSTSTAQGRAESQRTRILDAAQRCFIAHGFHAASISTIAAEAGISQGLMYRYFNNKRAMILALIERQLDADRRSIGQMPASLGLVDALLGCYQLWARGESIGRHDTAIASVALYAEITAEAQRDPLVAEVLRRHDKAASDSIQAWLKQHDQARGAAIDDADLHARTLRFRVTVEGLAMRAVRDPDLSPAAVRGLLEQAVSAVIGQPPEPALGGPGQR